MHCVQRVRLYNIIGMQCIQIRLDTVIELFSFLMYHFVLFREGMLIQKGNRTYLNQEEIDDMEDTMVKAVPPTPNGPAKYEVL